MAVRAQQISRPDPIRCWDEERKHTIRVNLPLSAVRLSLCSLCLCGKYVFMIARIWHGRVPLEKSEEYLEKMRSVALPDYERTPGNRGAYCLHRVDGVLAYFQMLTFWDDIDAIKRFAGEDYNQARYYDFDDDFLIEKEPFVLHYEVSKR
jgi:hypothetical protein